METRMTEGNPLSLIVRFTVPLFLGNIFQQIYNMADTVIVGKFISAAALAAVGSTGVISFLVLGLAIGMTTGFSVMTSQYYGAKDAQGVRHSVTNGIIMSVVFSLALTCVSLLVMPRLLVLMNTPEDIYEDALSYMNVICTGTLAIMFYNLFSAFLRAIGNSRIPLFFLILSSGMNILLDLLFIIVFQLGVAGAAWATVIAEGISAMLCAGYIYARIEVLRPRRGDWRIVSSCAKKQLAIGIPMCLETGITASGTLIQQSAVNIYGTIAVAGYTAAYKVIELLTGWHMSVGQSMASYAGQNYGAGRYDRIIAGTRAAMKTIVLYSVASLVLGELFLRPLVSMFFDSSASLDELLPWSAMTHRIVAPFYIPLGMIFVYRNTIQGCGHSVQAMAMGLTELGSRVVCALVSLAIGSFGLAVGADPAAWVTAGSLGWLLYRVLVVGRARRKAGA